MTGIAIFVAICVLVVYIIHTNEVETAYNRAAAMLDIGAELSYKNDILSIRSDGYTEMYDEFLSKAVYKRLKKAGYVQ